MDEIEIYESTSPMSERTNEPEASLPPYEPEHSEAWIGDAEPRRPTVVLRAGIMRRETLRSPLPRESEHNVVVREVNALSSREFFERAIDTLRAVYRAQTTYPSPLLDNLVDNPHVDMPRPTLQYDDVRLAGNCSLCGYNTVYVESSVVYLKALDCNRCVAHPECAAYMVARGRWPGFYCVKRAFGPVYLGNKRQCAYRNNESGPGRGDVSMQLNVKRLLNKCVAQPLSRDHATGVQIPDDDPVVTQWVTSLLERDYVVRREETCHGSHLSVWRR